MVAVSLKKKEKLQSIGIDTTKMTQKDTISTLTKKSGIDIEKWGKENNIDIEMKIGKKMDNIAQAYRGKENSKRPTDEQVKRLKELGHSLEKKDSVQEFIELIEKLQSIEIDTTKMTPKDTISTLAQKSEIDIEKLKKENDIDIEIKIGNKMNNIAQAYRGKGKSKKPTDKQVKRLKELGHSLEKKRRTGKEIAEATIGAIKNMDMSDREDSELKGLVEKTKEGNVSKNE